MVNPSKERVIATLNHEEPDRVPLFELAIDAMPILKKYGIHYISKLPIILRKLKGSKIDEINKLMGPFLSKPEGTKAVMKSAARLFRLIGYDVTVVPVTLLYTKTRFLSWDELVDEYGRRFKYSKITSGEKEIDISFYNGGYFDTEDPEAAYDEWGMPDPDHPARRAAFEGGLEAAGDKMVILPGIAGVQEKGWEIFGFNTFTKLLYKKPHFIERVFEEQGKFALAVTENMLNLGAEAILIYDDYGWKAGPMLKPKDFERLVVPHLKRICDKVHSYDRKVILHSDGNLYKIMDLILSTGIDGLHPWESGAGMDIFKGKEDYGERLTLIGNVDPIEILTHGTIKDVENYVRKLIKVCAPGGGYILSSGHSITYSVKLENFEKMIETIGKYGIYPIK